MRLFTRAATIAAAALAVAAPAALAAPAGAASLRELAAGQRLWIGTAVDMDALAEQSYSDVLRREFSSVTPENAMKWETVEPRPGVFEFGAADRLLAVARRNRQSVYGHVLVWHSQLPLWLTEGSFSRAELARILRRHIVTVVRHFRGRVRAWDVVNEAFNDDGTWRDTIWYRAFGPDYIAMALRWARQADPHVKLMLNDYNTEGLGPKSDAYYRLVQQLSRQHATPDGIGIQGHLSLQYPFPTGVTENLSRFAALGLDLAFTEVDVRMALPPTPALLAAQAGYFGRTLRSCLAVRRCDTYTIWGFTDAHSWVPGWFDGEGAATPLDEDYRAKPAYAALVDALREGRPTAGDER
jgi:endo-1,4-beta-xylanase